MHGSVKGVLGDWHSYFDCQSQSFSVTPMPKVVWFQL
jgi:hypothetical protein